MTKDDNYKKLNSLEGVTPFAHKITGVLTAYTVEIFQINVGKLCNLSCRHCHVEAGPHRKEEMRKEIFLECYRIIENSPEITTIDLTGGAPEMNENISWFIEKVTALNKRVIVRSNLLILLEDGYEHFFDLFVNAFINVLIVV